MRIEEKSLVFIKHASLNDETIFHVDSVVLLPLLLASLLFRH